MAEPVCEFCKKDWNPGTDYRMVEGWERFSRVQGGTNALRVRQPKERFACRWCVDMLASGKSPSQGSLL